MAPTIWTPSKGGNSGAALKGFIERIENLNEEKQAISADVRDVFAEAKGNGFEPKIMRIILRRRAMNRAAREEQDALVATYAHAIGEPAPDDEEETTSSSD
jgi:uncharacterized protein (UPF0335 family)